MTLKKGKSKLTTTEINPIKDSQIHEEDLKALIFLLGLKEDSHIPDNWVWAAGNNKISIIKKDTDNYTITCIDGQVLLHLSLEETYELLSNRIT